MKIISSYIRRYLGEHFRKHPWAVGLATAAVSGFGLAFYIFQFLGIVAVVAVVAGLESMIIFGWPAKKAFSRYFHLQSLYYEEVENQLPRKTPQVSTRGLVDEVKELYKAYTLVPKNPTASERTIEIPLYPPFIVRGPVASLLSLPCFLRLDRIEQLSFAHHIFEGAKHSRREHVLGVMYLVRQACTPFLGQPFDDRDLIIGEVAALLHDLFHTPYGHALDGVGRIGLREGDKPVRREWKYDRGRLILALKNDNWFQTALAAAGLTKEETEIILRMFRLEPDGDVKWLRESGKYYFIANLIQGWSIDMDRLDYVNRDALHTFGTQDVIDYRRLLGSMESPKENEWSVLYKENAADLLRASEVLRYKNFALVYESDENASAEEMVSHAIFRLYKRFSLSAETLRELLMLSEGQLEDVATRYGGDYEQWMIYSATHEARSYVSVASYPVNLDEVVTEKGEAEEKDKVNVDRFSEIFSAKTTKELFPNENADPKKALAFVSRFSKKLKELHKTKLDPKSSTEAFIGKVFEEHKLSTRCFSTTKKKEADLHKRSFPSAASSNSDEPIIFMRGAIEDPWVEDPIEILRVRGKGKSLSEYFGQRLVANPKVYRLRIFAPFELKDLAEEIKERFESYLIEEILPSE